MTIAHGSACGVAHLHRQGVVHGDIAARNVLLCGGENRASVKISDFGLARMMRYAATTRSPPTVGPAASADDSDEVQVIAVKWCAPERLADKSAPSTLASDTYSFGVLLFEIFARKAPFSALSSRRAAALLVKCASEQKSQESSSSGKKRSVPLKLPSQAPARVRALAARCLAVRPTRRPTMRAVQNMLDESALRSASEDDSL